MYVPFQSDAAARQEARERCRNVRVAVCDLDGTLLDSRKRLSAGTLRAVREARSRGVFVTLCSGRVHRMLEVYSRALGIEGALAAANGAVGFDTRDGSLPWAETAPLEPLCALLEYAARRGFDHLAVTAAGCRYAPGSARVERFRSYNRLAEEAGLPVIPLAPFAGEYRRCLAGGVYKALIAGLDEAEGREAAEQAASLGGLSVTSSEPGLLDAGAAGADKGAGVRRLAALLGAEKEEVFAIGDYRNDIPMFAEAGFSVAMGNADACVKAAADAVTASNDEDGAARALWEYVL